MRMLNNYLLCENASKTVQEKSGFESPNLEKFKKLKVICSEEVDVPVGSVVKVSVNSGQQDDDGVYIHRRDIISFE